MALLLYVHSLILSSVVVFVFRYRDLVDGVLKETDKFPGLYLGGNYLSGVAFGDCVLWGVETSKTVAKDLGH